jgi:Trk K+ transport system NAD-binding subunit
MTAWHTVAIFCVCVAAMSWASAWLTATLERIGGRFGFSDGLLGVLIAFGADDPEFEHVCLELGLEDTIIPERTIGRYLADMCEGRDPLKLSTMIRDEARVLSFIAHGSQGGAIADLGLPTDSRVVCVYREDDFFLPDTDFRLQADDEVVMITRIDQLEALTEFMKIPT